MADATTPNLVNPTATLTSKLKAWQGKSFNQRKGTKGEKMGRDLEAELVTTNAPQEFDDDSATIDTAASTGEFFLSLIGQIVTALKLQRVKPLDLNVDWVPFKIGDYYVFTGTVAGFDLTRFETLTFDDSGATLAASQSADFTIGALRVVICRLLAGTVSVADAVLTGGSSGGTLTITAGAANQSGGANNRCPGIGGRLKLTSTGAAHAAQTSIPISYLVEGSKIAS